MKDPNDPYTPDLFDAAQRHPGKSPEKSPRQKAAGYVGIAALLRAAGRFGTVAWLHQATAGGGPARAGMAGCETGDDAGGVAGDIANSFHP